MVCYQNFTNFTSNSVLKYKSTAMIRQIWKHPVPVTLYDIQVVNYRESRRIKPVKKHVHDDYTHFECTYDDSGVYEELHLVIYESNEVHYGTWSHEQDDALKRRLFRFFDEVLTKELDQERFIELHLGWHKGKNGRL